MPTAHIAAQTAAANGADVTVAAGTPATFGLFTAAGGTIPNEDAFTPVLIRRKNPSGTYDDTGLVLTAQNPCVQVSAYGIYRAEKPVTRAALGVNTD